MNERERLLRADLEELDKQQSKGEPPPELYPKMSEWQGSWRCEKCGLVVENMDKVRSDYHLTSLGGIWCEGKLLAFDRRGPDPEKTVLAAERDRLRDTLREIAEDPHCQYYHPEVGGGQYGKGVNDGHRCAARKARAVLAEQGKKE